MATGRELKQIYEAMKQLCVETSRLIVLVKDRMGEAGFVPVDGTSVMWDRANSYVRPTYWLPYFQQMMFVPREGHSDRAVGINILWDDEELSEHHLPLVSVGVCYFKRGFKPTGTDKYYYAGWHEDSKLRGGSVILYETTYDGPVKQVVNYFLPVEALSDEVKVWSLVIEPMKLLYRERFAEAEQAVSSVAQRVEYFTADQ